MIFHYLRLPSMKSPEPCGPLDMIDSVQIDEDDKPFTAFQFKDRSKCMFISMFASL